MRGHLLGAAVDVFPVEPAGAAEPFVTPLQGLPNVILTPHIGGSTGEAQERIGAEVAHKLIDYSDAGSTLGAVNFPQVQLPGRAKATRYIHIHHNVPGMLGAHQHDFLVARAEHRRPIPADGGGTGLRRRGDAERCGGATSAWRSCAGWRVRSGRG